MADFPTLVTGARVQLPYTFKRIFQTSRNDQETGKRYAWSNRAIAKRRWEWSTSSISDAECNDLKIFFDARSGQYETFGFTDPHDGVYYPKCRFASEFERRFVSKDVNSVMLVIETVP